MTPVEFRTSCSWNNLFQFCNNKGQKSRKTCISKEIVFSLLKNLTT
jgi:hypothetical protein